MCSEVKLKAAAQRARRGKLHRNFFALFGDLVAVVSEVGGVQLQIEAAGFHVPHGEARRKIGCEMLIQTRAALHDCSAAVAQRGTDPGISPATAVEQIGGAGVGLVKGGLNTLAGIERLVAGEAACYRAIEKGARQCVLQARAYSQPLQIADVQDHVSSAGARGMEVDGKK